MKSIIFQLERHIIYKIFLEVNKDEEFFNYQNMKDKFLMLVKEIDLSQNDHINLSVMFAELLFYDLQSKNVKNKRG